MNKYIFLIITIITIMFGYVKYSQATPNMFENCNDRRISPMALKSKLKVELIEGYCTCIAFTKLSNKNPSNKQLTKKKVESRTASDNGRMITRMLQRHHEYPDAPACDIK